MLISIFRAFFLYLLIILLMRIMGKREIGQLQPYELAITLIISELVALPMENNSIPLLSGVIPVVTITIAQVLFSYLTTKSQWLQDIISGRYTIIIENGKMIQPNMLKQKYNITELLEQLRMNGVVKIDDVEYFKPEETACTVKLKNKKIIFKPCAAEIFENIIPEKNYNIEKNLKK